MIDNHIDVSLILPAYNVERYIAECIKSIQNQTFNNIEIIVVDDGSTDSTNEIVKSLMINDKRIKLLEQINSGVSCARNNGIKKSKGKYIMFIDPDDYIENKMVEILYNNIEENNCEIAQCNHYKLWNEKKEKIKYNVDYNTVLNSKAIKKNIKKLLISGELSTFVWDKIYLKSFLVENKIFFDEKLTMFEDWYFIMQSINITNRYFWSDKYLYNYRVVIGSLSRKYINNYVELNLNLQDVKRKYAIEWFGAITENFIISLYSDIFKMINYLNNNIKMINEIQYLKLLKLIANNKTIINLMNIKNITMYNEQSNINKIYATTILIGINLKTIRFMYLFIRCYRLIKNIKIKF